MSQNTQKSKTPSDKRSANFLFLPLRLLGAFAAISIITTTLFLLASLLLEYDLPKSYFVKNPDEFILMNALLTLLLYFSKK